jgi:hypothetical protein
LRLRSRFARRPSPAFIIASLALFISMGGAGYAAVTIPNNSVGSAQLRNNSVSYKKIQSGAVGNVRANTKQLQERVYKTCAANSAIASIAQSGTPNCTSTLPGDTGTTSNTASVPTTASSPTTVNSATLATGSSYLAFANPDVTVTGAGGAGNSARVRVSCTLTVGSNTQTRAATVSTGATTVPANTSIPLQLAGPAGASSVACSSSVPTGQTAPSTAPTVSVTSALNAIQVG